MTFPFWLGLALAALSGFIALAYELVWTRLFDFVSGSSAEAFGGMLGSYLFGLAIGSLLSRRWQQTNRPGDRSRLLVLSRVVIVSNVVGFLVVPAVSWLAVAVPPHRPAALFVLMAGGGLLVMPAAALLGIVLPLLCHLAIPADRNAGARMSYVYLANIIGSALGSLLTGFFLMEWLKLWQIESLLLLLAVVIGFALAWSAGGIQKQDCLLWSVVLLLAGGSPLLHQGVYEHLQSKGDYRAVGRFPKIVESRHGVVTVTRDLKVFGNGAYDGVIQTDLTLGSGMIRPYFVSAVHAAPRQVLVIGNAAGVWTQILAHNPQVEEVTVVEISHAYFDITRAYPQVAGILSNPKVHIIIDDGRRWLRRNPDRRFDAIVMNTTFYYRYFAGALLSREFLELAKGHLNPGGIMLWNTTGSARAARTGMEVFPYTLMIWQTCEVASCSPLHVDKARWRSVLAGYRIEGRPVLDLATPEGRRNFDEVVSFVDHPEGLWDRQAMQARVAKARLITDDNMGDEYGEAFRRILQAWKH